MTCIYNQQYDVTNFGKPTIYTQVIGPITLTHKPTTCISVIQYGLSSQTYISS